MRPEVSVLIPCYNAESFLEACLKSVLEQELRDIEVVLVDDGSTDGSRNVANSFGDERIRVLSLPGKSGPANALNAGLSECRGRYIARMDADDIAYPNRLRFQRDFMDRHPQVGVVAGYARLIGSAKGVWKTFRHPEEIRTALLFGCPLCHPTVMMRRTESIESPLRYNTARRRCEDYDLWVRLSEATKIACLPEIVLDYRIHPNQITHEGDMSLGGELDPIFARALSWLGLDEGRIDWASHRSIASRAPVSNEALNEIEAWMNTLIGRNEEVGAFARRAFRKVVAYKWLETCRRASDRQQGLKRCLQNPLLRTQPMVCLRVARSLSTEGGKV